MSDGDPSADRGSSDDGPTNDALLEALADVDDEATGPARGRMYTALLDAQLIVPVTDDEQAIREDEGDLDLDIPILTSADGRSVLSVFSDEEALTRFEPDGTPYVAIEGRTLFRLLAADPPDLILLNAAGPIGLELEEREIAALARGQVPPGTAGDELAGTQLRIGTPEPDDIPVGLVPAARDALAADPDLVEGYLLTVASEDGEESRIALGVAFAGDPDEEAIREAFETVADQVRDHVGDRGIGMFPLGHTLLERLRGSIEPLYEAG